MHLVGQSMLTNAISTLKYTLVVAQASVCGVVVADAPLSGVLFFTDPTWNVDQTSKGNMFAIGSRVYLKLIAKGLVDIESMVVDSLLLDYVTFSLTKISKKYKQKNEKNLSFNNFSLQDYHIVSKQWIRR